MLRADIQDILNSVGEGDRVALSKAITLIESKRPEDRTHASELISHLEPRADSIRLAISGAPGVGKSTFIEALGLLLIQKGLKPAILTIDPSSHISGGSILGDRTRMETLSRSRSAFIRQSPSSHFLGGVGRRTRETVLLCENAGYDVIIIETVGVGQSEYLAGELADLFVLLVQPGSGDDLQGIKRGVMEMSDLLVVTKADGDLQKPAALSRKYLINSVQLLPSKDHGHARKVLLTSAMNNIGMPEFWQTVKDLMQSLNKEGYIAKQRDLQKRIWLKELVEETWLNKLTHHPGYSTSLSKLQDLVIKGELSIYHAAQKLIEDLWRK